MGADSVRLLDGFPVTARGGLNGLLPVNELAGAIPISLRELVEWVEFHNDVQW